MRVGGPAGRLVEFRQRQRGAQAEAARALPLRDGDGGQQGVLRRRGVDGVAHQQHFAARPMQLRFERAITQAIRSRQRFVEDGDGAIGIARPRLGLGQRDLEQPIEKEKVLFAQEIDAATHVLEPAARRAVRSGRPTLEERGERAKLGQVMLARQPGEFGGLLRDPHTVAAHQVEQRRMVPSKRQRAAIRDGGETRPSVFGQGHGALDVAERPQGHRRAQQDGGADVNPEAKGQIVVAARLEQGERAFEIVARFPDTLRRTGRSPRRRDTRCRPRGNWGSPGRRRGTSRHGPASTTSRHERSCLPTGHSRRPADRTGPCRPAPISGPSQTPPSSPGRRSRAP